MRKRPTGAGVLLVWFAYGFIAWHCLVVVVSASRGTMLAILEQGRDVNRPCFHVGTALIGLSAAAGMLTGEITRWRRSLRTAVLAGIAAFIAFCGLGYAMLYLAIRFP